MKMKFESQVEDSL